MNTNIFKKINFLNQTGNFNYSLSLNISNPTGFFEFGFSGSGENLSFNGQYGKLKDKNGNIIIGYTQNKSLNIEGSIYSGKESLSINELSIYKNIENTGYNFNYFYLNPFGCELEYALDLNGESTDFDLKLANSKIKDFNITGADGVTFSTKTLTGIILNQNANLEIKIFSAEVLNKTDYYSLAGFPISFYNSGEYLINTHTGEDALVNDSFEARFYTNFGIIDKTIQISGEVIPLFFLYFNILPEISGFPNIQTGYDRIFVNNLKNYYVSYGYVSGAKIQASLTYLKGLTGYVTGFLNATGTFSGYMSGLLKGSGFLSTFISGTGINFSGFNDFTNSTQVSNESGFFARKFFTATGYTQDNYYVTGFGLGSGIILKDIYASGIQDFAFSGMFPVVGGLNIQFTPQLMTGTGKDVDENNQEIYPEGLLNYDNVTNVIKILYTGVISGLVLNTGQYGLKKFNYTPTKTGIFEFEHFIFGTGLKSGISSVTGVVAPEFFINLPFGYFEFKKIITGEISGDTLLSEQNSIFTGYQDLFSNTPQNNLKYLATAFSDSSSEIFVTGYTFLDPCDSVAEIPTGFYVSFKNPTGSVYLAEECGKPSNIEVEDVPKWIIIRPTGVFELVEIIPIYNVSGNEFNVSFQETFKEVSGYSQPLNSDDIFFSQNTGQLYQTFSNSSGFFRNLIKTEGGSGIAFTGTRYWDQYINSEIKLNENYSNFYIKNFNANIISLEDNGRDYPSEAYFIVKNNNENYNFQLTQNNTIINNAPQRDLYLKLILSKKILDGYSGIYESTYFKSENNLSFCTGLSTGEYRAKIKYINFDSSPKIKNLCRIPVQVANILDKNAYNQLNIDLFTGSGQISQNFYTFRYFGSGWHQQANIYYTKTGVYGHNFITGYTSTYRQMLYERPYIDQANNFVQDNRLLQAINLSLTGLSWSGTGVRNINIFTNRIALSGISKNEFLKFIKDIYTTGQFIVNVFNYADFSLFDKQTSWTIPFPTGVTYNSDGSINKLEVFSTDVNELFFKDIAEIGGGQYYCPNTEIDSLYVNRSYDIAPFSILNQRLHVLCDGLYPVGSFPNQNQPGADTTPGQTGIDLITFPPIPNPPPSPPPPGPPSPPSPSPAPPGPETEPGEEEKKGIGFIFGGGDGGGGGGGSTGGTTSRAGCTNPRKFDLNLSAYPTITRAGYLTWKKRPKYKFIQGRGCICTEPGIAQLFVKLVNLNCAPSSRYVQADLKLIPGDKRYTLTPNGGKNTYVTVPAADGDRPGQLDLILEGQACGPKCLDSGLTDQCLKNQRLEVMFNSKLLEVIHGKRECKCECPEFDPPSEEYDLTKCKSDQDIVRIFRWDCEMREEARNIQEQAFIDKKYGRLKNGIWNPNAPWWLKDCRKCGCDLLQYQPIYVECSYTANGNNGCGGWHQCDDAIFIIEGRNTWTGEYFTLGIANLNNGNDGGSRPGLQLVIPNAMIDALLSYVYLGERIYAHYFFLRIRCSPALIANGGRCHSDASYYKVIAAYGKENQRLVAEGCGTVDNEIKIDFCPREDDLGFYPYIN